MLRSPSIGSRSSRLLIHTPPRVADRPRPQRLIRLFWGTPNLSTQSARYDDSVAVVHAVQLQQVAVLAGPHA
jgi:hypothetical protein